jgi:hypothetical protein
MKIEEVNTKELSVGSKHVITESVMYLVEQNILKYTHKDPAYYDESALTYWRVDLSERGEVFPNLFSDIEDLNFRKVHVKSAIEDLVNQRILYPDVLKSDDPLYAKMYLINPAYYYEGTEFYTVHTYWAKINRR